MSISLRRIGPRLSLAFAALLLLNLLAIGVGYERMGNMGRSMDVVVKDLQHQGSLVQEMSESINSIQINLRTLALLEDAGEKEQILLRIQEDRTRYKKASDKLADLLKDSDGKASHSRILDAIVAGRDNNNRFTDLVRAGKREEATALLLGAIRRSDAGLRTSLDGMLEHQRKVTQTKGEEAEKAKDQASTIMVLLGLAALGIGSLLAWTITRSITRPVAAFAATLATVAGGDLRAEAAADSRDELGEMGRALNETIQRLREAFLQIQESAYTISQASAEIASGNQDLSSRTEEQAASLEETASSMEELTSTVHQTAENAGSATQAATQTGEIAEQGAESVGQLVSAMDEINRSSNRIAEIIGVVDEIAFQTNLLALNAAVEAARAGEQGRGFAVVASEVRNLAKRSADAAKEIKGLIKDSVAKAQDGQKIASDAGHVMGNVVHHVNQVNQSITEIAGAAQEQSTGINEINKAITQMDEVTQQNAALVEEAAAAAESLDEQAKTLSEILSAWNTGQAVHHAKTVRVSSARPRTQVHATSTRSARAPRSAVKAGPVKGEIASSKPPVATPQGEGEEMWESF